MKISLIHPSRSRPELARKTCDTWLGRAEISSFDGLFINYVLSIDSTDPDLDKYKSLFHEGCICINDNKSAIEAINNGVKMADGDVFVVISDDFDCPWNWYHDLLKHLNGKIDFCAKTQDGIQPWMMTMPIMDRVYYERYGFIYNPAYQHMYCDLELSCVADMTGKTVNIPMLFKHNHYTQKDGIKKDAVTIKNDSTYKDGERIFLERAKRNFDLPDEWVVSDIKPDANCYNWFVQKGVFK